MKNRLIAILLAFASTPAYAETQATANNRVMRILQSEAHVSSQDVVYLTDQLKSTLLYATAAELTATTPADGFIGYAIDTDVFYLMINGAWQTLSGTMANGATIANGTNNHIILTENSENGDIVFSNNLLTFDSTTGATYAFTPAVTHTGDVTFSGAAGAITFGTAASSILLSGSADNQAAGLDIGSTGHTATLTIDSTNSAEGVVVTGYETVSGVINATGGVDRATAAALAIGASNATAVNITPATTVTGLLTANGGLVMGATVVTSTGAITSATSGQTIVVQPGTDAVITVTLPAASTKSRYCFVYDNGGTAGSTKALSIATPTGSDLIIGTTTAAGGTGFVSTAGASHGVLTTHANAIRGDSICLAADGTNTWYQTAEVGTWASF